MIATKTPISLYEHTERDLTQRVKDMHEDEGWVEAYPLQCVVLGKDFLEKENIHIIISFEKNLLRKRLHRLVAHVYRNPGHKGGEDIILLPNTEYGDLGKNVSPHLKMIVQTYQNEIHVTTHFCIEADSQGVPWYPQTPATRTLIIDPKLL